MAYNGVYAVNLNDLNQFERWLGEEVDSVALHGGKQSWSDWLSTIDRMDTVFGDLDRTHTFSIPMFANGGSLEKAAAGAYDNYYVQAAKKLASHFGDQDVIYVRTGEELNGMWFPWAAKGREGTFVEAYRNFVDAFRSVSDKFQFEWNVAIGQRDPSAAYPGDNYVDVIGMDFYWDKNWDPLDPVEAWDYMVNRKWGLQWHQDFAKAHGKPTAYSEWGVTGDNAGPYLQRVAEWFDDHDVLYANYWDSNSVYRGQLSENQFPNAGKVFKSLFADGEDAAPPSAPAPTPTPQPEPDPEPAPTPAPVDPGDNSSSGNVINGNDGANVLRGGSGSDTLTGEGGADQLYGGAGNDAYYLGFDTTDKVYERAGEGVDVIYSSSTQSLAANVENIVLSGWGRAGAVGNELNNKMVGSGANNYLRGNEGADTLEGGGGADTLEGSEGGDILRGGAGNDVFMYSRTGYSRKEPDRIVDLSSGDKIDFSLLDANTSASGDQAFTKVASLTGKAGQAVVSYNSAGGYTQVVLDVNGDKDVDTVVHITGNHTDFTGWIW